MKKRNIKSNIKIDKTLNEAFKKYQVQEHKEFDILDR